MTRLCNHFRHKVEVVADEKQAQVRFPFGECQMQAEDDALTIDCQAETGEARRRLEGVIADHLQRFSGEEALVVEWVEGPLPSRQA
jgi:hypothetical protein